MVRCIIHYRASQTAAGVRRRFGSGGARGRRRRAGENIYRSVLETMFTGMKMESRQMPGRALLPTCQLKVFYARRSVFFRTAAVGAPSLSAGVCPSASFDGCPTSGHCAATIPYWSSSATGRPGDPAQAEATAGMGGSRRCALCRYGVSGSLRPDTAPNLSSAEIVGRLCEIARTGVRSEHIICLI